MKNIVFVAGNSDTQLKSYLPIIVELSQSTDVNISVIYTINFMSKSISRVHDNIELKIKDIVDEFYIYEPKFFRSDKPSYLNSFKMIRNYQNMISFYLKNISPDLIVLPNNKILRNRFIYKYASINDIYTVIVQDTHLIQVVWAI